VFLRQTLNSYARLIWVRLPSGIFQQLSIHPTAGKTGKTQVKHAFDRRAFKLMIAATAGTAQAYAGGDDRRQNLEK